MKVLRAWGGLLRCLALVAAGGCAATGSGSSTSSAGGVPVRIIAIDVGQGDATLIIGTDGTTVLIDGGGLGEDAAVRAAVDAEAGGRLDHVVVTHFDADHLGGLARYLVGPDDRAGTADDGAQGAQLWDYGDDSGCTTQTCTRYRTARGNRARVILPGDSIPIGDGALDCVAVNGDVLGGVRVAPTDENSRSVSLLLRLGGFRAFLGGDLTGGGLGTVNVELPVAQVTGRVDVLKVDHHGSDTSSNASALALWAPRVALFSQGTDNTYCHPAQEALDRVAATGARVIATGGGIVTGTRCAHTRWPSDTRVVGTIRLTAYPDARVYLEGEALP